MRNRGSMLLGILAVLDVIGEPGFVHHRTGRSRQRCPATLGPLIRIAAPGVVGLHSDGRQRRRPGHSDHQRRDPAQRLTGGQKLYKN